jgi:hypothetical protein
MPKKRKEPAKQENKQTEPDSKEPRIIDPLDLVYGGGYIGDPKEILSNPAVAPQMPDDAANNLRDDFIRD